MKPLPQKYSSHIKVAFFVGRLLKWFGGIIVSCTALGFICAAIWIGKSAGFIFFAGLAGSLVGFLLVLCASFLFCYCPRCGEWWWSFLSLLGLGSLSICMHIESGGDETETLTCRRCKLELGPYLRR